MEQDLTDASPITDGLFRLDGSDLVLLGGRSRSSGRSHFPRRDVCPWTGADDVEAVELPRAGTLWAWTSVEVAPPGYHGPVPYALGVVQLSDGLRVVGRLTGLDDTGPEEGRPMVVVADTVTDADGDALVTWAFAPVTEPAP